MSTYQLFQIWVCGYIVPDVIQQTTTVDEMGIEAGNLCAEKLSQLKARDSTVFIQLVTC